MEKKLKNAIWFSRHQPTPEQLAEIAGMGWQISNLEAGLRLGAMNLQDDGDMTAVGSALLALAAECDAVAIIGVWTGRQQEALARTAAADSVQVIARTMMITWMITWRKCHDSSRKHHV